jgi:hypothetical protein
MKQPQNDSIGRNCPAQRSKKSARLRRIKTSFLFDLPLYIGTACPRSRCC